MSTFRFAAITSFFGRLGDSFQRAWEKIKPGPVAWKGAALGLLVVAVFFTLIAAYAVFLAQPRIASFLTGSVQFIAMAAIASAGLILLITLLWVSPRFTRCAVVRRV